MKTSFALVFSILLCISPACNRSKNIPITSTPDSQNLDADKLFKEISKLETKLSKATEVTDEMPAAIALVKKSQVFGETFPDDERSPSVLFKGADVARGIGNYGKGIQLWGMVWRNYPDFERAPDALFLQGFTFENNLFDYKNAKDYYINFLSKHEEHPLAEQVKLALRNLGKSPSELIEEFEKKGGN